MDDYESELLEQSRAMRQREDKMLADINTFEQERTQEMLKAIAQYDGEALEWIAQLEDKARQDRLRLRTHVCGKGLQRERQSF